MPTDYNLQYQAFHTFKDEDPMAKYTEVNTLKTLIGPSKNLAILDIGCGYGYHSLWLAESGARKVVGIDISEDEITVAKKFSKKFGSKTEFMVGDAEQLLSLDLPETQFDLCIAMFMLTHLNSVASLERVFRNVSPLLASEGRFIGAYPNVVKDPNVQKKYNFSSDFSPKTHWEGSKYTNRVSNSDGTIFECEELYLTPQIMRRCAEKAGFLDIQLCDPIVSDEGKKAKGLDFWKEFLQIPIYQFFVATKF